MSRHEYVDYNSCPVVQIVINGDVPQEYEMPILDTLWDRTPWNFDVKMRNIILITKPHQFNSGYKNHVTETDREKQTIDSQSKKKIRNKL